MIVEDYPTKDEVISGRACMGAAGRLIAGYLRENSYDIEKTFKTCYIKEEFHMPRARKERRVAIQDVKKAENWGKILGDEIANVNPNVIISAGELSSQYLTSRNNVSIYKLRGSIIPISDIIRVDFGEPERIRSSIRCVPVIHPRDIISDWTYNAYTSLDYGKAVKNKDRTDVIKENYLLWICRTVRELGTWWSRAQKAKFLTVDIETFMGHITCIGFCHDGYEAISIPLVARETNPIERGLLLRLIYQILGSGIPLVNQNIKYDHHHTEQWGLRFKNVVGDTMLLGHCIYPELPKGLDFYTSIYTDISYYKDDGRDFNPKEGWDTLFYYNAKDALTDWIIYEKQIQDAKEVGVYDFYTNRVWPLYGIYKKMEDRGIRVDTTARDLLLVKYETMLSIRRNHLETISGKKDLNFNSPKQISDLVYGDLNFPKQFKTNKETGKKTLSCDEETLEELILNYGASKEAAEILWSILWCRKIYKILGYIKTPFHSDGRMRTNVKLAGTKSGRTSNSETTDWMWFKNSKDSLCYDKNSKIGAICSTPLGLAFQTIPKHGFEIGQELIGADIRKMYVSSPGYTFVEGDGGQAEARVVCILSDDEDALNEMNRKDFKRNKYGIKDDLHTKTSMLVLSKGFDDITELDRQDFGKKPRHAGNYDMGAFRLSLMAHISIEKAQQAISRFHSNNPKVREVFHRRIRSLIDNKRMLSTPHGRIRQFFDRLGSDTYKEAFSYIPQAVVSDHIKFDTLTPLIAEFENDAFFLSESHDSLFFEVRNNRISEFNERFRYHEEQPILFSSGSVISEIPLVIPLEIKTGENWYEMKAAC